MSLEPQACTRLARLTTRRADAETVTGNGKSVLIDYDDLQGVPDGLCGAWKMRK